MKSENQHPFEVQSYIGTDIANMGLGEGPPRSAKLVVDLKSTPTRQAATPQLSSLPMISP
jgi:hypothetical protein